MAKDYKADKDHDHDCHWQDAAWTVDDQFRKAVRVAQFDDVLVFVAKFRRVNFLSSISFLATFWLLLDVHVFEVRVLFLLTLQFFGTRIRSQVTHLIGRIVTLNICSTNLLSGGVLPRHLYRRNHASFARLVI